MIKNIFTTILFTVVLLCYGFAFAKICPYCGKNHLPDPQLKPPVKDGSEDKKKIQSVTRLRFSAPSIEIADEADRILDRLTERYGKPANWEPFPIYFERYRNDGIAGYTSYSNKVNEVVVFETFKNATGGTLDHELTHAFWFYLLNSNFDLFLNEGIAQNSEYRRRESLRQTVYRRYSNGEFVTISKLYGRNSYDGNLLIYHEGFTVVDFLIGRGGSLWFSAFMEELTKTNDIKATLAKYYGYKDLADLEKAVFDYIENGQDRTQLKAVK